MRAGGHRISSINRSRLLLGAGVAAITIVVWLTARAENAAADRAFDASRADQGALTAMLDRETGFRGFVLTRRATFLEPYRRGRANFDRHIAESLRVADEDTTALIEQEVAAARRWQDLAARELVAVQEDPTRVPPVAGATARKRVFDRFRELNRQVEERVGAKKDRDLRAASMLSIALVIGLSVLFAGLGYLTIERQAIRDRRRRVAEGAYRSSQAEFTGTMQVMRDEAEAYLLVKRHLERRIPEAEVTVLNRNNSDNRLVATTAVPDGSELARRIVRATPESCLAVRLGRAHESGGAKGPLLACELCGGTASEVACVPSLVGGEVIGAVLMQRERPLEAREQERLTESVAQAAPVLANLRTLALAETRAATDALTGLPNARTCHDTLKRLVANAGRTLAPLSAVLLDLDHFKQINDRFGHGAGDDVLATTGQVLAATIRASDFAGRAGGEEFLLLLPDTGPEGAQDLAEKVRLAISQIDLPGIDRAITASLGVATYPVDAADGDTLLRQADRALYAAKAAGRDRVELAMPAPPPGWDDPSARTADALLGGS